MMLVISAVGVRGYYAKFAISYRVAIHGQRHGVRFGEKDRARYVD